MKRKRPQLKPLKHHTLIPQPSTNYKLALKSSLYDFTSSRDFYREATTAASTGMHHALIHHYIRLQALILAPIAPHWADYIWQEVLHNPTTIQTALWPQVLPPNPALTAARDYVRATTSAITSAEASQQKRKEKGKSIAFDPKLPKKLTIFCASTFPAWQQKYIDLARAAFDGITLNDKPLAPQIAKMGEMKKAMPFVQALKKRLDRGEEAQTVFERKLAFDEVGTLREMRKGLKRTTGCVVVEIVAVEEGGKGGVVVGENREEAERREGLPGMAESAVPGGPAFHFENVRE